MTSVFEPVCSHLESLLNLPKGIIGAGTLGRTDRIVILDGRACVVTSTPHQSALQYAGQANQKAAVGQPPHAVAQLQCNMLASLATGLIWSELAGISLGLQEKLFDMCSGDYTQSTCKLLQRSNALVTAKASAVAFAGALRNLLVNGGSVDRVVNAAATAALTHWRAAHIREAWAEAQAAPLEKAVAYAGALNDLLVNGGSVDGVVDAAHEVLDVRDGPGLAWRHGWANACAAARTVDGHLDSLG